MSASMVPGERLGKGSVSGGKAAWWWGRHSPCILAWFGSTRACRKAMERGSCVPAPPPPLITWWGPPGLWWCCCGGGGGGCREWKCLHSCIWGVSPSHEMAAASIVSKGGLILPPPMSWWMLVVSVGCWRPGAPAWPALATSSVMGPQAVEVISTWTQKNHCCSLSFEVLA